MDVLHEIFRSNGKQQTLIQQHGTQVSRDRGRYLVRGMNRNPTEIVSVYLTEDEVDRLIRERRRQVEPPGLWAALRVLRITAREKVGR